MTRLFIAVDLPDAAKSELIRLLPASVHGIRLTRTDQMHLTLHFLGDVAAEPVVSAMQSVQASTLSLTLEGIGEFRKSRGPAIVWAGVRYCAELWELRDAVAAALYRTGYRPERRAWSPHVTLARSRSDVPRAVIDEFLMRNAGWHYPTIPITEFTLYASELLPDGPIYRREATFPLIG